MAEEQYIQIDLFFRVVFIATSRKHSTNYIAFGIFDAIRV